MNQSTASTDLLRSKFKKKEVTSLHIFLILFSVGAYISDVVFDIILAVNHFTDGNIWFFVQTVCSIIVPALILTGFNIWWYKADADIDTSKVSTKLWIIRVIFIILLMAPLLRNFEALYCAIKSINSKDVKRKEALYLRMISFITDAAILTVFEAFLESGPQVILQTCIFAQLQMSNPNVFTVTEIWQIVTVFLTLLSMSIAYATYQRSLRFSLDDKRELNLPKCLLLVTSRFFDITSRVIALGLFASIFPYYLILVCCAHFSVMFIWIRLIKTDFCTNGIREFVYNIVLAELFVFFYFNPKDGRTQHRYTVYYILIFFENTTLICVWYLYYSPDVHFRLPALILQFVSFVLAIVLMIIYYYFVHPTRGKISQKCQTKKPSEAEMKNSETNTICDENEHIKLNAIKPSL